jgi:diguanylate cyclase (GGDEF)-like protein
LFRFDGRSFKPFGPLDGLNGHIIQTLFEAPDGTLFVGTTTGVYFLRQDGQFTQLHPPAPFVEFSQRIGTVFTALAPDQVVTADRDAAFLIRRQGPDNWVAETMHLDGASVWSVLSAPNGVLWYGCDSDLCRLQNGKTTHLRAALDLPEERWLHLFLARNGHLWIRGATHLGEVFPGENRFELHDLPGHVNTLPFAEFAQDPQGRIVASQGPDFGLWEAGHWRMVTSENGLTRYDISDLFVDREGSLWIGVIGHGLTRWDGPDRWEAYTTANGLSDDIVWDSLRDHTGRLWIATESGLDLLSPGDTTAKLWQSPAISTDRAASLAESDDGAVWMGSASGNLVRIDPKTLAGTQWPVPEVFRVISDGSHHIWIATDSGLFVVDTTSRDQAPQPADTTGINVPLQRFRDLTLDRAGQLWTTTDHGIYRKDNSGWHHIDPGMIGVTPYEIASDPAGYLWTAGPFPGVIRLRIVGDKVMEAKHVVPPDLLSDSVVALLVDHRGWIWVGQDAGVSVYDGHSWRGYTQADGLIWNDSDSYALTEDRDGSVWIGTSGGLSHLKKPQGASAAPPSAPVFSQITFGADKITNDSEVPWSASPLAISIAALNFRNASHIRIRYRLMGIENEWVETAERNLRYPRLEPGPYRLQAVAVDETDSAVSPIEEVSFVITPLWWQSGPLRLTVVLLIALAVVLAWRWSVHLLVMQKRHLEEAVERRTQDLEKEKGELLRTREQMRHFAEHDDLTGLWNHRIIVERLRQEVERSRRECSPLSVILVDLDHFKAVNDTFGHPSGDMVLREIGAIFQAAVRSYDWVGRYGGEEFLLILPGSGFEGARMRAEQLRTAVEEAYIHDGERAIPVTASFGVASGLPSHFETLINAADAALYRAKDNGRNRIEATEVPTADPAEHIEDLSS